MNRAAVRSCALCVSLSLLAPAGAAAQGEVDVERAMSAVRQLADAGHRVAQFTLAEMLYFGSPDTTGAIAWYRRAAAQGLASAEFRLGQFSEFGFGVNPDIEEALRWYRLAASHDDAAGARAVGEFFLKGRGVDADAAEAARWFRLGAERDDLRAQYELGQLYLEGRGVPRDNVLAYVWFSEAASQTPLLDNYKALVEFRNIAAARMSPGQLTEAERLAAARRRP